MEDYFVGIDMLCFYLVDQSLGLQRSELTEYGGVVNCPLVQIVVNHFEDFGT